MIINKKEYTNAKMTFGTMCRMEAMGAAVTAMEDKPMTVLSAYAAISMNKPLSVAQDEIEAHIVNGGDLTEVSEALREELEKSGFFRAILQKEKAEA